MVELVDQGYKVLILDNLYNASEKVLPRLKEITGKGDEHIILEIADLKDFDKVEKIFAQYKPQTVIHFAALKAVGESVAKPLMYYENNVTGTINLIKAMEKHDSNTLIFSSSACVYGDIPFCKETDSVYAINPYG